MLRESVKLYKNRPTLLRGGWLRSGRGVHSYLYIQLEKKGIKLRIRDNTVTLEYIRGIEVFTQA